MRRAAFPSFDFFFFNDTATTEIYTLSLHDALPIYKCFDRRTGLLFFDLFNLDGILGDKFTVNGKIQPVLHVSPRRYRFRWLDAGPSRLYQFFLAGLDHLSAHNLFWQVSTGRNLLPKAIQSASIPPSRAER